MPRHQQIRFWLIGLLVACVLIWLLRAALVPFVAGIIIAYLLNPVAGWIEKRGAARWLATTLVLLGFVVVLSTLFVVLVPVIAQQIGGLLAALPSYLNDLNAFLAPIVDRLQQRIEGQGVEELGAALSQYAGDAVNWVGTIIGHVWRGGMAILDVVSLLVITPVVAFYLLRDWDRLISAIDSHLPRPYAPTIRHLASEVDSTLSNFLRGQGLVCLILGSYYAIALSIAGLNFAILVGLGAGVLSFIPYVGSIVGFIVAMGIALAQFDAWVMWLVVAGIYFVGQAVEGNVLAPKLVGDSVGLHPVWIMFALIAGGSLFGFTGVLLGVPVAAIIGVLVRFALERYRGSGYYRGDGDPPDPGVGPDAGETSPTSTG